MIFGGDGDDTIHGGDGDDVIDGGAGDDIIWGGSGNDTIYGRDGDDQVSYVSGIDNVDGGDGTDLISFNLVAAKGVIVDLNQGYADVGTSRSMISNFEDISGTAQADQLYGSSGQNSLTGGEGNDLIYVWSGCR